MATSLVDEIPLVVAVIGLGGVVFTSYRSNRNDERHHAREALLKPAEDFARAALHSMAKLRYVTPPDWRPSSDPPHRNERLLTDPDQRQSRFESCARSIDALRLIRADVRLVFHPESQAAELSRQVLASLRLCLESAEEFYMSFDRNKEDPNDWRRSQAGSALRDEYKRNRLAVYASLDAFFVEVSNRLAKPSWQTRISSARGQI